MSNLPRVTLRGNLTADPELRTGRTSRCAFSLAVTEEKRGANGTYDKGDTHYFDCVAWASQAEHLAASARKGDQVIVDGVLKDERWETNDGEKRRAIRVHAYSVGMSLMFEDLPSRRARAEGVELAPPNLPDDPWARVPDDEPPF